MISWPQSGELILLPSMLASAFFPSLSALLREAYPQPMLNKYKESVLICYTNLISRSYRLILHAAGSLSVHSLVSKCCAGCEVPNHITELLVAEFSKLGSALSLSRPNHDDGRLPLLLIVVPTQLLC